MKIKILIAATLLALTLPMATNANTAGDSSNNNWGWGLYLDQDLWLPVLNEDRDYTMGIAVEFFWQDEDKPLYLFDDSAKKVAEWFGLHRKDDEIVRSFSLGSVNYTPDDLADPNPIYDDRPYASIIYLSNKRVRANAKSAVGVELQVGLLGLSLGEKIQSAIHQTYRDIAGTVEPVDPRGWRHQISNGGELTLRIRLSNSQRLAYASWWDLAATGSFNLGYQSNVGIELSGRVGKLASHFWSLPFDPITRGNLLPSKIGRGNELYLWSAYRLRLVGYDALLQGQFRDSTVAFSSKEIERVIHEGAVGMAWGIDEWQLSFSINGKTPELRNIVSRRDHYWGGINLIRRY
jgi:hypothetical protein